MLSIIMFISTAVILYQLVKIFIKNLGNMEFELRFILRQIYVVLIMLVISHCANFFYTASLNDRIKELETQIGIIR